MNFVHSRGTRRALELIMPAVARTLEITNSKLDEFDVCNAIWTVPAERM